MGRHLTCITLILSWAWVASADAQQVATNITPTARAGDLGTNVAPPKVTPAGKSFDITGGARPSNGDNHNLFHSFDQFSVGRSDIANFVNDTGLTTQNILSRVTGGSPSDIFGTIKTTDFPGADLFLLNPHGIVFGDSAKLDVQGSFHASTADFIRLEDERQFDAAVPSANDALLTTARPTAFGFLQKQPAAIAFRGSGSGSKLGFAVSEKETLSVIGGDIKITEGSLLRAPGGRVNVASVASEGEVTLGGADLGTGSFARLGKITMKEGSTIDVSEADGSETGGGRVLIRGGEFVMMDKSKVLADTKKGDGKGIDIKLTDALVMEKESSIQANTKGAGDGGKLHVEAQDIHLNDESRLWAKNDQREARGDAGQITIRAERLLRLRGGSQISAITDGPGRGGNIVIEAGEVVLEGITKKESSRISADTFKEGGPGGDITIRARYLRLTGGAQIGVSTKGPEDAGNLTIRAREIVLEKTIEEQKQDRVVLAKPTIFARSEGENCGKKCGDGGNITIAGYKDNPEADRLHLKDGAEISASTRGSGKGGNLSIHAKEVILEDGFKHPDREPGQKTVAQSSLNATAQDCGEDCGHGGDIIIIAERLQLKKGGVINVSTHGSGDGGNIEITADEVVLEGRSDSSVREGGFEAVLSARTRGDGEGGNITIKAGRLQLKGEDAAIRADSGFVEPSDDKLPVGKGNAGTITIKGKTGNRVRSLEVRDGAQITTGTLGDGDAGLIDVKADTIKLVNRGRIASASGSEPDGTGNAGRVSIDAKRLEITGGGSIATTTRGPGRGGAVDVEADEIVLEGRDSGLFAGSEGKAADSGGGGDLTVNAGSLMVKERATISASTFGPGEGGKVSITAADLELRDGASITSESRSGGDHAGQSGEISIRASDSFRLFNDSQVSVKTAQADAGDIGLDVGFLLHLRDSSITTSVADGEGDGGNINIDPVFVILDNSKIIANAFGGPGGNIHIVADHFFASPDSDVDASSKEDIDGVVDIESPDTDLNAGLVELPADFFDVATLLTQGCSPGADLSRLVVRKYEALPDSPAALRVPPPGGLLNADAQSAGFALTRETLGPGFEDSIGCDGDG